MVLIDTDILIDAARKDGQALTYLSGLAADGPLSVSVITQLELLAGCRNGKEWKQVETALATLVVLPLTAEASAVAVRLFSDYRLSHGIALADALIAATALSRSIPLASKNQRDYRFIAGLNLLPYPAP